MRDDDDLPYPGYTRDGPTEITLDLAAYRRLGFEVKPGPLCWCGNNIFDTRIWAYYGERGDQPALYFCAACMPAELKSWILS